MKKFLIVLCCLFLMFCGFVVYDTYFSNKIPTLEIEDYVATVDELYIYGRNLNILGSYDFDENVELVLYNGDFITYNINKQNNRFNISENINDGLYLDEIPRGDYYLFFRTRYISDNEEKFKYYALKNNSEYAETIYYTMSNYNNKITINSEESYPTMMIHADENHDKNIYDIVIDPGHGGIDGGASKFGYKETDFTMDVAVKLKKILEEKGFKIKLTHEEGQLTKNDRLEEYGVNGRAVIPREVNAKFLFSIHLNSNIYESVSGLEVYTAKNINYDFAKSLVKNITNNTGLNTSNNTINKVFDGIYSRNFTNEEINSSTLDYNNKNLNPYDITTNSNYYYIIRETGGIITGAYVDSRNDIILGNPFFNSNVGTETYLLELGYISNKNNLNNMKDNMDKYVDAISSSIEDLYQ